MESDHNELKDDKKNTRSSYKIRTDLEEIDQVKNVRGIYKDAEMRIPEGFIVTLRRDSTDVLIEVMKDYGLAIQKTEVEYFENSRQTFKALEVKLVAYEKIQRVFQSEEK